MQKFQKPIVSGSLHFFDNLFRIKLLSNIDRLLRRYGSGPIMQFLLCGRLPSVISHLTVVKDAFFSRWLEGGHIFEDFFTPSPGLILGPIGIVVAVCENDSYVSDLDIFDGFRHDHYVLHVWVLWAIRLFEDE